MLIDWTKKASLSVIVGVNQRSVILVWQFNRRDEKGRPFPIDFTHFDCHFSRFNVITADRTR